MVIEMVNTNLKPASPAAIVPSGTNRIPVFEEIRCGKVILIGYVADPAKTKQAA